MPRNLVGRKFDLDGHSFEVVGLHAERPAKPVSVKRDDGVVVALTVEAARKRLKDAKK